MVKQNKWKKDKKKQLSGAVESPISWLTWCRCLSEVTELHTKDGYFSLYVNFASVKNKTKQKTQNN